MGCDEQVEIICHQDIGVDIAPMLYVGQPQLFQIKLVIGSRQKNRFPVVATDNDMLWMARNNKTGETSHGTFSHWELTLLPKLHHSKNNITRV